MNRSFIGSPRKDFLEKPFLLQFLHCTVIEKLLGFIFFGFGARFEDELEHLPIEVGDAFDHVDADLPARLENFGVIGVEKFGNRFLAALFIFLQHGDAFSVTGDEILDDRCS
jgi:hypothetical protein